MPLRDVVNIIYMFDVFRVQACGCPFFFGLSLLLWVISHNEVDFDEIIHGG